jgi:putative DNA primase/helicase
MMAATNDIRALRQWLVWRLEERHGRPTKIPYSPATGQRASSTTPENWVSYQEAVRACKEHGYDGIGFVFSKDDPFCGLDLDDCLDPKTGELESWARQIVEELDSYTEISPSGTGVHILMRATLPVGRNRKGRFEAYDKGRYFTVSGKHLAGTPRAIENRQEELQDVVRRVFEQPSANGRTEPVAVPEQLENGLTDDDVIRKALAASNGERFSRLWTGSTDKYGSSSEADLALCGMLAFWTGPDPEWIARLFRHSGLYRRKWERKDYRERTIARALEGRTEFYVPGRTAPLKDNSVKCDPGETTIEKALEGPTEVNTTIDDKWEDPVPLPEGLPTVASLDPTMIPKPLRGWIVDISERMQIPPDFAAAGAVVVA